MNNSGQQPFRIAMLSRLVPDPKGPPAARLLYTRLSELAALNVSVLLLTRYSDLRNAQEDRPSFSDRIDTRRPFLRGTVDELVSVIPLLARFRPDVVHVIDGAFDGVLAGRVNWPEWLGFERGALVCKPLTRLQRVIVSTTHERSRLWPGCVVETEWMMHDSTWEPHLKSRATGSALHVRLGGNPKGRKRWLLDLRRLLDGIAEQSDRTSSDPILLYFDCDRATLSRRDREKLAALERLQTRDGKLYGTFLRLEPANDATDRPEPIDIVIAAGCETSLRDQRWPSLPRIITDRERDLFGFDATVTAVPDAAWQAFASQELARFSRGPWGPESARPASTDCSTNKISRLYFTALVEDIPEA